MGECGEVEEGQAEGEKKAEVGKEGEGSEGAGAEVMGAIHKPG